jgi:CBS domain-containing protein
VREFLLRHPPFSGMDEVAFAFLIPRLKLAYFPKDAVIIDRQTTPFPPLHIVLSGSAASQTAGLDTLPDRVLAAGECFPVGALSAEGPPTRSYRALEDVFAYTLGVDDFRRLRQISPAWDRFCTEAVTVLAQQSLAELQRHYSQIAADQHSLNRPLGELIPREPVQCTASTPLADAIGAMREHGVRSIIVIDDAGGPAGIFTLNDLRDRVVLQQVPLTTPVGQVATAEPLSLPTEASAGDAIQQMAASGFHQVIVTEHGRVRGIVSERDLFALQRVSLRQVHHAIRSARDLSALERVATDIRNLSGNLLAQGVAAEPLTRTIAALNDSLGRQVIAIVQADHALAGIEWCWLALGSEGRGEQTLATDQDNALIFVADDLAETLRSRQELLAFARETNAALDRLGFPLCTGGIMAGNPQWCLGTGEWRNRFTEWLTEPTPERLLNANIFFDLRPLAGRARLAESLMQWLLARTQDNKLFLRLMVANALQIEPPLGLIRAFAVDDEPHAGTIDLKTRGARLFVDAARVFALAFGIEDTGTAARLRRAGERVGADPRHVAATVDAFHYLQMLRLRTQEAGTGNRIDPYALNEIDQRMLKESLRQARKLQQRLKETFSMSL